MAEAEAAGAEDGDEGVVLLSEPLSLERAPEVEMSLAIGGPGKVYSRCAGLKA